MENQIKEKLQKEKKTYITLEEIEKVISTNIPYTEFVNIIKQLVNDGILKVVRKR